MSPASDEDVDVIVVGGGPAGSTVATVVAKRGHRVLLLEKETFPRYQIGESLVPSTIHGICRILGVTDEVAGAGFPVKRGGLFRWGAAEEPWTFSFGDSSRLSDPTSTAFQVERSRFDEILLRNAARCGVDVREGVSVTGVVRDGERVCGVQYTAGGVKRVATARYVVDASGNTSRLHGEVAGKRTYSEFFRNLAVFGYFEGGARLPAPSSGNIFCAAFDEGWLWYIPLRSDLTSVGAVVSPEHTAAIQKDPRGAWRSMIERCPQVRNMLRDVPEATAAPYDRVRVRKDYSYWKSAYAAPGMLLVGDSACFIDPVFSSGVHLATYGALLAARSINSCLDGTLDEPTALAEFESRYRREYGLFYDFLVSFYDMHQDKESYFWSAKRVTNLPTSESEAFVDLVGGLMSGLVDGSSTTARWEAVAADVSSAIAKAAVTGSAKTLGESAVLRETFSASIELTEPGLIEGTGAGELIASGDGLSWAVPVRQ